MTPQEREVRKAIGVWLPRLSLGKGGGCLSDNESLALYVLITFADSALNEIGELQKQIKDLLLSGYGQGQPTPQQKKVSVDIDKIVDSCMYDFPKSYTNAQIVTFQKGVDKVGSTLKKIADLQLVRGVSKEEIGRLIYKWGGETIAFETAKGLQSVEDLAEKIYTLIGGKENKC